MCLPLTRPQSTCSPISINQSSLPLLSGPAPAPPALHTAHCIPSATAEAIGPYTQRTTVPLTLPSLVPPLPPRHHTVENILHNARHDIHLRIARRDERMGRTHIYNRRTAGTVHASWDRRRRRWTGYRSVAGERDVEYSNPGAYPSGVGGVRATEWLAGWMAGWVARWV